MLSKQRNQTYTDYINKISFFFFFSFYRCSSCTQIEENLYDSKKKIDRKLLKWTLSLLNIYQLFYSFESFSHQRLLMGFFYWSLRDIKSSLASRTLLNILTDLNNAKVWIVSSCLLISKLSCPFTNPLGIVPRAPITFGIIVTFMFYSFFSSLDRSRYLSLFSPSFNFTLWSAGTAKSTIRLVLFF